MTKAALSQLRLDRGDKVKLTLATDGARAYIRDIANIWTKKMADSEKVVISFDPATGKFEFSAPSELLTSASEHAQILIKTVSACLLPEVRREQPHAKPADRAPSPTTPAANDVVRSRKAGGSSGRSGRIGSFDKVDFGLNETQERAIYDFYTVRRPSEQAEQVVLAMYIGAKVLGRSAFNYNEIYTLLHLGGERDLPKALDVVLSSLIGKNWVAKTDKAFALKFLATDFVEKLSSEAA